jgi:hypothetical protein
VLGLLGPSLHPFSVTLFIYYTTSSMRTTEAD